MIEQMTTEPKVLFVQPVLPSYRLPVFSGLARRGFDVTCWSDHHPKGSLKHVDPQGSFATSHRREQKIGPFLSQPAIIEASRSTKFDLIVLPWNVRYLELPLALLLARARGLPTVLWGHARSKRARDVFRLPRNRVGRLATACLTYEDQTRLELIRSGFEPHRVFAAQNAVDDEASREAENFWTNHPAELEIFRAESQVETRPIVLFVSRLERAKRIDFLIQSFARVVRSMPEAHLVIIGDGPERETLQALVRELGLDRHVEFLGTIHDERALAAWFSSAKLLAYPTNIGLSLLHAFSYGLPVVTSDSASEHNPEYVALSPGQNGLTYRSHDQVDFAEQILRCLKEADLQAQLSRGARETVAAKGGFNLTTMLDGMERALRFALSQRSTTRAAGASDRPAE